MGMPLKVVLSFAVAYLAISSTSAGQPAAQGEQVILEQMFSNWDVAQGVNGYDPMDKAERLYYEHFLSIGIKVSEPRVEGVPVTELLLR